LLNCKPPVSQVPFHFDDTRVIYGGDNREQLKKLPDGSPGPEKNKGVKESLR